MESRKNRSAWLVLTKRRDFDSPEGSSLATGSSVSAATLAYSTLPCPKATPRAIQILERDIILSHILSIHGLCSISPWFRCHHLFAKLDHMHLMRDHLGDVLFFAVLALP